MERPITIGARLKEQVDAYGHKEAVVYSKENIRYTYEAFYKATEAVAKGLLAAGIQKGDHIAVWATNVPEWVLLQFGSARIGAVLVTVNTSYQQAELEYLLKQSDTKMLFLIDGYRDASYVEMAQEVMRKKEQFPLLESFVHIGPQSPQNMMSWDHLLLNGANITDETLYTIEQSLDPDDVINMQYTSGTTGFPKGVMLTHNNVLGNAERLAEAMKLTAEDSLCIPVPFFHCFGCVIGTLTAMTAGATMVPIVQFNPRDVLQTVEKEKCTALHGVPTMFIAELNDEQFSQFDLSSLRTGVMAGSTCPIEVMKKVINAMGMSEITIAYGQTETSPVFTQTRPEDPIEKRVKTVGKKHPGVEIKVVDPVTNEEVAIGQPGELCTRGYHVMKGYYKMPDATMAAIDQEGWLHTGDLAVMDEDGYVTITGRLKDMIIRGGENIYPREVEEFLYSHPAILDVQVIGVPDEKYGEKVAASIRLKEGKQVSAEEIITYCTGQIAKFKIPEYIFFVKEYPMTASGKIQKYKLREEARQLISRTKGIMS
ncbi:AMP-binding domain protein [Fictibacillus macauensis ZFHKF-1]|uniref:AMP-binding domain protein n=1 Tax=Fictibacillus macauensis ZFHKF-1 TaxID=1196324 RepID=I8J0D1_9BACL|nr:AMP-binding protein [Fictibacillus macauensis]EIT85201.1 AMP-binding domain protein [Fictibacillus macauensis ZFHKF-1]